MKMLRLAGTSAKQCVGVCHQTKREERRTAKRNGNERCNSRIFRNVGTTSTAMHSYRYRRVVLLFGFICSSRPEQSRWVRQESCDAPFRSANRPPRRDSSAVAQRLANRHRARNHQRVDLGEGAGQREAAMGRAARRCDGGPTKSGG